jgi:hypothetical protein
VNGKRGFATAPKVLEQNEALASVRIDLENTIDQELGLTPVGYSPAKIPEAKCVLLREIS